MTRPKPLDPSILQPWTAAEDDRLRELRAAGLSASMIARELPGRTRNAVIGRFNRLGAPLPTKSGGVWTPELVERLKALVAEGLTFAEIGALLGISRGACIGKAERLGLRRGEAAKHPRGPRKRPGQPHPRPDTTRGPQRATPAAGPKEEPMPAPSFTTTPTRLRCEAVPLWQVRDGQCRWPIGDPRDVENFRFCGEPVSETRVSWCRGHAAQGLAPRATNGARRAA